jgi:glutaredoxin
MHLPRVVVYSRPGCHLCDDACRLLESYGLTPEKVDISANPDLLERYGHTIPVVEFDGKVRFHGRVDRVLLERLLAGKA